MNLFSFNKISKSLSGRQLFDTLSLGMNKGEKIALVGTNGTGKSTFLKILLGKMEPDSGTVHINKKTRISYLGQEAEFSSGETISDFILKDENPRVKLVRDFHRLSDKPEDPAFQSVLDRMDLEEGWGLESQMKTILHQMGIFDENQLMKDLSGGLRRRAALSRALLGDANLLVLDEPANHLDIPTILELQKILKDTDKAVLMVSHDRYLIDEVCDGIWELEDRNIYPHKGGYAVFLKNHAERLEDEKNRQLKIANILRTELDWLSRGPKARGSKDKKRKDRIHSLLDERKTEENGKIEFSVSNSRGVKKILEVEKLNVSFGSTIVIKNFSFEFLPGHRLGILGPNGAGKSTLLNWIAGDIEALGGTVSGTIDRGQNAKIGYFRQLTPPMKDSGVIEFLKETAPVLKLADGKTYTPSQLLDWFQFPRSLHFQPISSLSGGERRRLFLVNVLLQNPNFLLLDEPTNDFDIQTLSALENFLKDFSGCLVVVSHDRYFLDRTVDSLLVIDKEAGIKGFPGNCTDYLEYLETRETEARREAVTKEEPEKRKRRIDSDKPKKLSFSEKKELENLEVTIDQLETEKNQLETLFSLFSPDPAEIKIGTKRFNEIQKELEEAYLRWEELSARDQS